MRSNLSQYSFRVRHQTKILTILGAVTLTLGWFGGGKEYLLEQIARATENANAQQLSLDLSQDSGTTSRYLIGTNIEYPQMPDRINDGDRVALWAKDAGMSIARYPGGTLIKKWDWKNPTGNEYSPGDEHRDPWDPEFDGKRIKPSNWMSLDEYLHFVEISGITPLIGVNTLSGLVFDKEAEGIARAEDEVRYVMSKGYKGVFYYLNNEDLGIIRDHSDPQLSPVAAAAENFKRYAVAIKAIDPQAKLIWNHNQVTGPILKEFLAIAGPYVDMVEFHSKWLHTEAASQWNTVEDRRLSEWQNQFPIVDDIGGFGTKIQELRQAAGEAGYPNLLFADNEYGLRIDNYVDFTTFTKGLVLVDLTQQFFIEGYDMAALWPGTAGNGNSFIHKPTGDFNTISFGLKMLADAQGKKLIKLGGVSPKASGFAVYDDKDVRIYLLNKGDVANPVSIKISHGNFNSGIKETLVDTPDHVGRIQKDTVSVSGGLVTTVLPALSFTKIIVGPSTEGARIDTAQEQHTNQVAEVDMSPEEVTEEQPHEDDSLQEDLPDKPVDPLVAYFTARGTKGDIVSGSPVRLLWSVEHAERANIIFSCDERIVPMVEDRFGQPAAPCGMLAFEELQKSGEIKVSFINKSNKTVPVKIKLAPQDAEGVFLGALAKTISLSVNPAYFTENLYPGIQDSEQVAFLQEYLKTRPELYPEGLVTGDYGEATRRAVGRLQELYGLGTQATPGFGGVGVKTRELLNKLVAE